MFILFLPRKWEYAHYKLILKSAPKNLVKFKTSVTMYPK